jgi:cytoskeleton protein RodZ
MATEPEPAQSAAAPTQSVDTQPDTASSAASSPVTSSPISSSPAPVALASAKVETAESATAAQTVARAPFVEQTVVIPSPPAVPQSMIFGDRSPRIYGQSTESTRIVLRAVQDSWVQVRDRQNALLLTRVLRAGDTYYVPSQDGLTLLTGNAGGLEIEVDGTKVPPLGPIGTVRRQIVLDPTRLLNGTAARR